MMARWKGLKLSPRVTPFSNRLLNIKLVMPSEPSAVRIVVASSFHDLRISGDVNEPEDLLSESVPRVSLGESS